jgi:hypothetical protein
VALLPDSKKQQSKLESKTTNGNVKCENKASKSRCSEQLNKAPAGKAKAEYGKENLTKNGEWCVTVKAKYEVRKGYQQCRC